MFTVNNIVSCCQLPASPFFTNKRDWIALTGDMLILTAIAILISLALQGTNVDLTTLLRNPAIMGASVGGCALVLGNTVSTIFRRLYQIENPPHGVDSLEHVRESSAKNERKRQQIRNAILYPTRNGQTAEEALKTDSQPVLRDLHVGNGMAFLKSSRLDLGLGEEDIDTTNQNKFTTVITVCPLRAINDAYDNVLMESPLEEIAKSFAFGDKKNPKVDWHYVGHSLGDEAAAWTTLVYDCTFPDTAEAQKSEKVKITPPLQWFEPIFKVMDKAVYGQEKILVHCADGVSLSATLIAAYLINRFDVTADQAVLFLKSKRPCVDPRFMSELRKYEAALKQAKNNNKVEQNV